MEDSPVVEQSESDVERNVVDAATAFASGGVGAFVGVVAGPAGVVIGGAVGAAIPHTLSAVRSWMDDRRDVVLEPAVAAVGGDQKLADVLAANPPLVPLLLQASDSASRSTWEVHVRSLALAFRDCVTGQRTVGQTEQLLSALVPMTPDGSAILRYMTSHDPPRQQDEGPRYFVDTELANDLGIGRSHVRAALRRLEDGGVVETIGSLIGGSEGWGVTPLAGEVALFLADAELV